MISVVLKSVAIVMPTILALKLEVCSEVVVDVAHTTIKAAAISLKLSLALAWI
jgi:hypothetical protein